MLSMLRGRSSVLLRLTLTSSILLVALTVSRGLTAFGAAPGESTLQGSPGRLTQSTSINNPKWRPLAKHITDDERESLRVSWISASVSPLDEAFPHLVVRGRLLRLTGDGKEQPVDWLQPIRVVIAKTPGDRQDWTKGHMVEKSANGDFVVNWNEDKQEPVKNGEFAARIPIAQIERPIGEPGKFQVGLSLGEQAGQTMSWSNTMPVLPVTVHAIEVPGQPVLSGAVQAINGAPSSLGWDYDPAAMVRAVNALQVMGKEPAINALRDYLKLARVYGPRFEKRMAASIDTSDQSCLELLIPLAFERIDPMEKLPERDLEHVGYRLKHERWPNFDVRLEDDIPFHVVWYGGSIGPRYTTAWLVDWAEDHGRLRHELLKPATDPLDAADRICDKVAKRSGMNDDLRRHIRLQALRMVRHLLAKDVAESNVIDPGQWTKLKLLVGQLHVRWDAERQEYVSQ